MVTSEKDTEIMIRMTVAGATTFTERTLTLNGGPGTVYGPVATAKNAFVQVSNTRS